MKDEELFRVWKSEQYKDQSTEEKMEFVEHLHTFPKYFETTFLAGLKAGRPQWHDLRKDKNDLPKKKQLGQTFIVAFAFNEQTQKYYSFDCAEYIDKGRFITHTIDGSKENNAYKVIAWCEIPTFDKE